MEPEYTKVKQKKYQSMLGALFAEMGIFAGILVLLTMLSIGLELTEGISGIMILLCALAPVPFLYAMGLWLDRYEPEPAWLLARLFLWGAGVATFVASIFNGITSAVFGEAASYLVSAPIGEELLKGLAILFIMRRHANHFNGVYDAIIYALFVGLGFAVVENVIYYAESWAEDGISGLAFIVLLRGILTPFAHPLFTMCTAVGIAKGMRRKGIVRWVYIITGYVLAVLSHAIWNSGIGIILYPILLAPLFIFFARKVIKARSRQRDLLQNQLAEEYAIGTITKMQLEKMHSLVSKREHFRALANSDHHVHKVYELNQLAYLLALAKQDQMGLDQIHNLRALLHEKSQAL